ncbi:hypothetical protein D3C78_1102960 [compost metagenome]
MGDEHVASGNDQRYGQHAGHTIGTAARGIARSAGQQRVDQRQRQADGAEHEQAREQRPEHQPDIRQGPDRGTDQERGVQPGTCRLAARDQQAGNGHQQTADQEVPGTTQADQFHAASGQRQAEQGDDHPQANQDEC